MLLMIDNYDSFTYNVVQYLSELGAVVKVVRNDELTVAEIEALKPSSCRRVRVHRMRRVYRLKPSSISPASCRFWVYAWGINPSARLLAAM